MALGRGDDGARWLLRTVLSGGNPALRTLDLSSSYQGPMVYAICYCPLSRLADLEALKVAGEPVQNVCTLGSWVCAGGQERYRGESGIGKQPLVPFSFNFLPRL